MGDQFIGQHFSNLGGEKAGVRVGQLIDLRVHRGANLGMAVAQAGHRRATRSIQVLPALRVAQHQSLPPHSHSGGLAQGTVKDVGGCSHGKGIDHLFCVFYFQNIRSIYPCFPVDPLQGCAKV